MWYSELRSEKRGVTALVAAVLPAGFLVARSLVARSLVLRALVAGSQVARPLMARASVAAMLVAAALLAGALLTGSLVSGSQLSGPTSNATGHAVAAFTGVIAGDAIAAESATERLYFPLALAPRRIPPLQFGVSRGFYDEPIDLPLSAGAPDAVIRYTTDGSEPSATHGTTYARPIRIETTSVVRAAAFVSGERQTPVATHTYIFVDDVIRVTDKSAERMGYPKSWGKYTEWRLAGQDVPADYGMSQRIVTTDAGAVTDALRAVPSIAIVTDPDDMFERDGIYANPLDAGREVAASIEYIQPDGAPDFQVDCGVRIAGNWSRKPDVMKKHAFSLRFRSRYGTKRLKQALFPGSPVASFDTLRLRGSQADSFMYFAHKGQYLHDQWARDTQREMGWLSSRGSYVHVYLNGLYWGLYNLAEEPTAAFTSDHLGGAEADWDVIKDGPLTEAGWIAEVEDGSMAGYQAMLDTVAASPAPSPDDPADQARYTLLTELLDVTQHIDYNLIQIYGANVDWPEKNYRAARDRVAGDGFQFFVWDYEHTTALRDNPSRGFCQTRKDPATRECGYQADTDGVAGLHGWLSRFPDYRMAFADRVALHFFGDGALTPGPSAARYRALADVVDRAIASESARWGSEDPEPRTMQDQPYVWRYYRATFGPQPQSRSMWQAERDRVLGTFFPTRTAAVLGQLCRQGLYPPVNAPELTVNEESKLSVSVTAAGCAGGATTGTVYYTLDGSDPREERTGAVSARARVYAGPIHLTGYSPIKARQLAGPAENGSWSALAVAVVGSPRLRVSEIMYHPPGGSEDEFIEIENLEPAEAELSGVMLSKAITFTFPAGTVVEPHGRVVVANDGDAFAARYPGVPFTGVYDGNLGNGGETVVMTDRDGSEIGRVAYDDDGFWPLSPDGMGFSLVPAGPRADLSDPEGWRASARAGGSPGHEDPAAPHGGGQVVINEVLANPGAHQEDAIEIHNRGAEPMDVGGWFLSDDRDELTLFRIPNGTVIAAWGYVVLYEAELKSDPDHRLGLSSTGETLYLSSADLSGNLSGSVRGAEYGAAEAGTALGRHRTPGGLSIVAMSRTTFGVDDPTSVEEFRTGTGAANARPAVGPVVLNEIMYHPLDGEEEFLELHNISSEPVPLHDPDVPARVWRLDGGVELDLPEGATLPPSGYALAVGADPDEFRARYGIPAEVGVFGPFAGRLDNGGETVALVRPWLEDPADDDTVMVVESVAYGASSPWPDAAAGTGPSLERSTPERFGADPRSWTALTVGGTPGRANTVPMGIYLPGVYQHR